MWSQQWCVTDPRKIDRESGKNHLLECWEAPTRFNCTPVSPQTRGGHGVKSVEAEYKQTNIKSAVKLSCNEGLTMGLERAFEEQAAVKGHWSLVKQAWKFAEELGVSL